MPKQKKKRTTPSFLQSHPEVRGLICVAISALLFTSLLSFIVGSREANWLGLIGYAIAYSTTYLLGLGAYVVAFYLSWVGWKLIISSHQGEWKLKTVYFSLFVLSLCLLLTVFAEAATIENEIIKSRICSESIQYRYPYPHSVVKHFLGGMPLSYLYSSLPVGNLKHLLSQTGTIILSSLLAIISLFLLSECKLLPILKGIGPFFRACGRITKELFVPLKKAEETPTELSYATIEQSLFTESPVAEVEEERDIHSYREKETPIKEKTLFKAKSKYEGDYKRYRLPPLTLLTNAKTVDQPTLKRDLKAQADILEETLLSFGVKAKVGQINCGPTITSFEVHPPIGVKVQKIKVLENDIALNLQAHSIRIIAPIPGKAAVGVEVPSIVPQEVGFKEMLHAYQRGKHKHTIPILLGKTVSGDDVMADLTKMPHCIIAGATGSGKSVCINSIIMSILMTARPDEIKLLLVDPKKVELSAYSNLPHMIAPVITEAHGAYAALSWLVREMQQRYEILKQLGLRNIESFNKRKVDHELEESLSMDVPKKMSFIVAIIDEFADLMMASSSDLETPIARIAQMARAVGIHLILATQRPSREVITGLIKANFPTRISFKVSSRVNSQIVLDENGAETLLGNGDLLFMPPGSSQLTRAQGVFVRDEDIYRVIDHIEMQAPTNYQIKSFDSMAKEEIPGHEDAKDDLFSQAMQIVVDTRTASTTFLQRKLKIGYARAAGLMDELEERGVVGPQDGSRPRKVLIDRSQLGGPL